MEMIGIVKRQAVIVLLFICFFPTMAVAQVDQFKLKQVLQDANAGDISACAYLGKMYYEGTGVAQNYNEAFKWYQKAADNGGTGAYIWLGVMYYNGQGVAQNYEKAFLWSKKAAENGAADAYVGLGIMYCKGQGVAQNYGEAIQWFQKAVDNGDAVAYGWLVGMYYNGQGVAQNYGEAFKWTKKAAEKGIAVAYAGLGGMYYKGQGVAQNYNEAFKWYQKAADNGVTGAYSWLGVMYYNGQGVAQNYEKAFLWTKKAAENGAADAYVGLGVMYCKGQGVAQNYGEAFQWFQKAADNGVASAFAYLGEMYYAGDGVAQNYNEAFKWFQKAADNGITTGIYYFLADMFYTGKTGITDYSQAKKYAELAIKNDTLDIVGHRILAKLYMYGYAVEKNIDKAEALIEQALAHYKKNGISDYPCNTMDAKGELFWVMGDKVKAKEIYDSINKNAPDFYAKIGETELSKYMKAYKEVDVDDNIPIVVKKNEKVFAVVIANEKYQMEKAVQYAKNDGRVFAEYCRKTLGLPEKNIHYVTDATLNNLKYELKWLQNVMKVYRGEAKVIFYYAGHGIPDEQNKNGYLLPIDGYGSDVTTGYALDDLFKTLGNMPSKSVTIFLDACFSGAKRDGDMLASTRGVAIKVKQNAPQGNMVVFSAAQGDETAYPYNEFEHGLFTYYLLKKLRETKGDVTLGELGDYIKTKVEQQSIVVNGKLQSPSIMSAPLIGNDWKSWKLNK
ncbi:hypothetical protein CFT61_00770 [Segatella copri]|uniref:Peptidase C14 caspase domain-containing protein n=1 Tax=Segatella copri TaxID=165179 RepID=A0AA91TM70_9BACT|nr:caspase family protein [Segatella copri]OXL45319.1 hypothetical protein CFT61_00770 [Segatella copri]